MPDQPTQPAAPGPPPADAALGQRIVRGGLWMMLGSYWMVGCGFLVNIILTRLLTPEVFGAFALALFFAELFRVQTKLGLNQAFISRQDADARTLGTFLALEALSIVAGVALTLLAAPLLLAAGYAQVVVVTTVALGLGMALRGVQSMYNVVLEKALHLQAISIMQSIAFPLSYIPAVLLALNGAGVWSLVSHIFAYYTLLLLGTLWLLRRYSPQAFAGVRWRIDWPQATHMLRSGFTIGLGLLATLLLSRLDDFYIGTFAGLAVLGFYDRAYRTAQWPSTLLTSLTARTALVAYARLQDDSARLQRTVSSVLWLIAALGLPLALALFVAAPDLIRLLYGEAWIEAAVFLRILAVFAVIRPVWENASNLFIAIGKPHLTLRFMGAQVAVLAVAGLPLTLWAGALGTCAAVGLAFSLGLALIYRHVLSEVAVHIGRVLLPSALASVLVVLGYVLLGQLTPLNDLPLLARVLLKGGYAVGGFYGLLLLIQPRATLEQVRYLVRLTKGALRRRPPAHEQEA